MPDISNAEHVSSELVGASRIITTTTAGFRFVVSEKHHLVCYNNGNLHRNGYILSKHLSFERLMIEQSPSSGRPVYDQLLTSRRLVADPCR